MLRIAVIASLAITSVAFAVGPRSQIDISGTYSSNWEDVTLVQSGDRVEFVQIEPGRFEIVAATRSVRELKGLFGKPARAVSIEEMNRAIATLGARGGRPK